MSIPARIAEQEAMYVPRSAFELNKSVDAELIAYNKFQRFYKLYRYVQKAGRRFWELEVRDETDTGGYLEILQSATRNISDLDSNTYNSIHRPPLDLEEEAHANLIRRIPDFSHSPGKNERRPTLDITYAEAHHEPEIRFKTMEKLDAQDDFAMEVVKLFEGWRYANEPLISNLQADNARKAYETYFFSVGSINFMTTLGKTATEFIKK
jgi:hypothetical protein